MSTRIPHRPHVTAAAFACAAALSLTACGGGSGEVAAPPAQAPAITETVTETTTATTESESPTTSTTREVDDRDSRTDRGSDSDSRGSGSSRPASGTYTKPTSAKEDDSPGHKPFDGPFNVKADIAEMELGRHGSDRIRAGKPAIVLWAVEVNGREITDDACETHVSITDADGREYIDAQPTGKACTNDNFVAAEDVMVKLEDGLQPGDYLLRVRITMDGDTMVFPLTFTVER